MLVNKTTRLLAIGAIVILGIIGIGFAASHTSAPPKQAVVEKIILSQDELAQLYTQEQTAIETTIHSTLPSLAENYTIERARLYDDGSWYGAILQYRGLDSNNRDTLRLVLQKKEKTWTLRTSPPQPLVSSIDLPEAPTTMLDDLNRPAFLIGTANSPAIAPAE